MTSYSIGSEFSVPINIIYSTNKTIMIRTTALLAITCILSATTPVHSQSIVGSWTQTDIKETMTDKSTGKTTDMAKMLKPMLQMMENHITFNADHTVISTSGFKGSAAETDKGTYTLEGNKLIMHTDKEEQYKAEERHLKGNSMDVKLPNFVTIEFRGGNLIMRYSSDVTEEGTTRHFDFEMTYSRR